MRSKWAEEEAVALTPIPEEASPSRHMDDMAWFAESARPGPTPTDAAIGETVAESVEGVALSSPPARAAAEEEGAGGACGPYAEDMPLSLGGLPEDLLHLQYQLSREVCLMAERLQRLECKVHSAASGYLETQLGKIMDAGRRDAEQRRELAETFASALQEERDARLRESREVRAVLADLSQAVAQPRPTTTTSEGQRGGGSFDDVVVEMARIRADEVNRISQAADAEWSAFSESVKGLGARMLEDLSEQHTQAALDLADRHLEAAKALDARSGEIAQLGVDLRYETLESRAKSQREVTETVRNILEDLLKDRIGQALNESLERAQEPLVDRLSATSSAAVCSGSAVVLLGPTSGSVGTTCCSVGEEDLNRTGLTGGDAVQTHMHAESSSGSRPVLSGGGGFYVAEADVQTADPLCLSSRSTACSRSGGGGDHPPSARPTAKVWGLEFLKENGGLTTPARDHFAPVNM